MSENKSPQDQSSFRALNQEQKITKTGTIMTHLLTYAGPNGSEYQLRDAEFKGKHYFDFRKFDPLRRGDKPAPTGIRLSPQGLELLEDAMAKWRRYYKQIQVKEAKLDI